MKEFRMTKTDIVSESKRGQQDEKSDKTDSVGQSESVREQMESVRARM